MSRMSWKTRLARTAMLCCLVMVANSLRAEDALTESVGHASVYTAPIPEADPGAGLFEPVTQLAGDSCGPCAENSCGPFPQAYHPPVYYPGLTDCAPTCFGARDWFRDTFGCLQHRANQKRLMDEYETRLQTAHWPTCCPPWACWGHYCDECPNHGCKSRCCLSELFGDDECHSGCGSHCVEGCSNSSCSHCIPGDSGASIDTVENVITLASYEPSELESSQDDAGTNSIMLVGHEETVEEEEGVYRLGQTPGQTPAVLPTNCTIPTAAPQPCVSSCDRGCNSTGCNSTACNNGCRSNGCNTPGCNGGCDACSNQSSSTCWSWAGIGSNSPPKTGWAMPFCDLDNSGLSNWLCKDRGTYVDEYGVTHKRRNPCFGYVHDLIPSCELLPRHACDWGYHCLEPAPCDCPHCFRLCKLARLRASEDYPHEDGVSNPNHKHHQLGACPIHGRAYLRFGKYDVAYEANPWHFDARDGRVYAAQGLGMPAAMPLAPNVQKTYNFGWGTPVSRLTPIWRNPQQFGP